MAQNYYQSNESFTVKGKYYRLSYSGNDTKFLGDVSATIEQTKNGFRLTKINGEVVKMDTPSLDLDNNQKGQVTECYLSDNYLFQAHYRKNGISYVVLFNSDRIRDYYISH